MTQSILIAERLPLGFVTLALVTGLMGCGGTIAANANDQAFVGQFVCTSDGAAPVSPMRRLTHTEYLNTLQDLLGVDMSSERGRLPAETYLDGFKNNVATQDMSAILFDGYHAVAELAIGKAVSTPALRDKLTSCDPSNDAACMKAFIKRFGRLVFRRALTSDEISAIEALAQAAHDAGDSESYAPLRWVLQGMLESPDFLYRPEFGVAENASNAGLPLNAYEKATRLSYLLWATTPSDELLAAAEAGALDSTAGLSERASTMLQDPRAKAAFRNFFSQWFTLDELDDTTKDPTRYSSFTKGPAPSMAASMKEEVLRLTDEYAWTEGVSFVDIHRSKHSYLDATLASLYKVSAPASAFAQADLSADANRGGLMSTAAVLTLTSRADETSVIKRGKFVRDAILCEHLALPANNNVPPLPTDPNQTFNELVLQHAADPSCAGCHNRIDPIGLGLERYDAIGAVRTLTSSGKPVVMSGKVEGLQVPDFSGAVDLGERLAAAPQTQRCVSEKFFRFSSARSLQGDGSADACNVQALSDKFASSSFSFRQMVIDFVTSNAFTRKQVDAR